MAARKPNRDGKGHFLPSKRTKTVYVLDFDEDGWCPELATSYFRGRRVTTCDANTAFWLRRYAASCTQTEVEE